MAHTFDMLRANDLVFNYVVNNWLHGRGAAARSICSAWNTDSTRMPATMHAYYLRSFYVRQPLARGKLVLGGERLKVSEIRQPTYIVAAVDDHIVPWRARIAPRNCSRATFVSCSAPPGT